MGSTTECLHAAALALSGQLTGFEVSAGAGSLVSSAGGGSVLFATATSTMGAAAVWLSVEVMAMPMALCVGLCGSCAAQSEDGSTIQALN